MLENIPDATRLEELMEDTYPIYQKMTSYIEENYNMVTLWNAGGKAGYYELKYQRSKKTLCSFYIRDQSFGFMVIYGKKEQALFEDQRNYFHQDIQTIYDNTKAYHDGKWIMLSINDDKYIEDMQAMIQIKKKIKK